MVCYGLHGPPPRKDQASSWRALTNPVYYLGEWTWVLKLVCMDRYSAAAPLVPFKFGLPLLHPSAYFGLAQKAVQLAPQMGSRKRRMHRTQLKSAHCEGVPMYSAEHTITRILDTMRS